MKLFNLIQLKSIYIFNHAILKKYIGVSSMISVLLYILGIFLFLFVLVKIFRLFNHKSNMNNYMYITDRIYLNSTQYVCILNINNMRLLLSVTNSAINLIHILPPNENIIIKKQKQYFIFTLFLNIFRLILGFFR
ncbi:flagellar biosynthetic protein FliO [Buchnera aphidicola]|uniref:Flagellar protein FliO, partial n=1 Tax=Buchnera aphidicola (Cinara strobi) TaxID=1921549 RepID=A0A3B1DKM3_9GAMM|nr:flagellar biosynthetic protein FliO [Buchnera aphidicola]VAX76271.1 Flagellar protein FliO [Buchnera aphidicola (Cinara strobi)]